MSNDFRHTKFDHKQVKLRREELLLKLHPDNKVQLVDHCHPARHAK